MPKWSGKKLLREMRNWRWWIVMPIITIIVIPSALFAILILAGRYFSQAWSWVYEKYDITLGRFACFLMDWLKRGERNAK